MTLIQNLKPVYVADNQEWQEVVSEINGIIPPLFWYAGAAFDTKPIISLIDGSFPKDAQDLLSPNIFPVLTDYNSEVLDAFKYIYENFDKEGFSIDHLRSDFWFASQLAQIDIFQMIPLTLFGPEELRRIRKQYQNFHPSVTSSVIPDDLWHFVFINARLKGRECNIAYGLIENLVFWEEVVEKYALNIEAFCALRVGGKSGSWDYTHSPTSGKLFNSIRESKSKKPRLWIADACLELREIWQEIEPHEDGFYGQMHFFETKWNH